MTHKTSMIFTDIHIFKKSASCLNHSPLREMHVAHILYSCKICKLHCAIWLGLTLSPPIPLRLYTLPYLSNPPFFNFWQSSTLALKTECQSAQISKIKNGGLDQYGSEPFKQQQFGTAGVEGVKVRVRSRVSIRVKATFRPWICKLCTCDVDIIQRNLQTVQLHKFHATYIIAIILRCKCLTWHQRSEWVRV